MSDLHLLSGECDRYHISKTVGPDWSSPDNYVGDIKCAGGIKVAESLIRACNAHDDLVEAALALETLLSAMGDDDWDEIRATYRTESMSFDPLEDLRAVLAKAKGE